MSGRDGLRLALRNELQREFLKYWESSRQGGVSQSIGECSRGSWRVSGSSPIDRVGRRTQRGRKTWSRAGGGGRGNHIRPCPGTVGRNKISSGKDLHQARLEYDVTSQGRQKNSGPKRRGELAGSLEKRQIPGGHTHKITQVSTGHGPGSCYPHCPMCPENRSPHMPPDTVPAHSTQEA